MVKWLTTASAPEERARIMVNTGGWNTRVLKDIPGYRVAQFRRQIEQTSFGDLDKLSPELLCMVLGHLSCNDLEALRSCSIGGRITVLDFPPYRTLLTHTPIIFSVLKKTGLARSFSIATIYETFASALCTTCGQFGGYVFLPSFSRCCLHCAETLHKFLPISRIQANKEFGVKGKTVLDSLPQLHTIEGYYNCDKGKIRWYQQNLTVFSHELVERMSDPTDSSLPRYDQGFVNQKTIKAYQRYMALTPLPSFIPKSGSMENGVYCAGCALRAKEHQPRHGLRRIGHRHSTARKNPITEGGDIGCWMGTSKENCDLNIAQDKLYDSRHVHSHLQGCAAAQALLKHKWTEWQKEISATET